MVQEKEKKDINPYMTIVLLILISIMFIYVLPKINALSKGDMTGVFGDEECRYKSPTNSTNDIEYLVEKNSEKYCCAKVASGFYEYERDKGTLTRFLFGAKSSGSIKKEKCNKLSNN